MRKMLTWAVGFCILLACNNKPADSSAAATTDTTAAAKPTPPAEFADPKYADIGKKGLAQFASGDIDGWMNSFADNAVYHWSSGDSLVGKAAITTYWKERRGKVIDSIMFSNDIWLPVKINKPQRGPDREGVWLLGWTQANVKYKNGKKLGFWEHTDYHFDANDKIDDAVHYIDMAPINKALGKK